MCLVFLLQTLLLLTILANPFACDLQRTINITLVSGSYVQFDYSFVNGMMLTILFQYPVFYSTSLLTLLQTMVLYLILYSLKIHATFTYCL